MKKIFLNIILIFILFFIPHIVYAETNTLPESVNGVITLEEDVTLSEKLTITNNVKIDLNNHVLKFTNADNHFYADVTIENGTIDISGVTHKGDGILEVGNYGGSNGSLVLNNVEFKGEKYSSSYAVIYVYGTSQLDINNSTMNLSNEGSLEGGVIKAEQGTLGKINITNSTLNFTDTIRGIQDGTVLIKDSNVTIKATKTGGLNNAINTTNGGLALTLDNTTVNISNAIGRGITLDNTTLNIKNASNITISDCEEGEIYVKTSGVINIDKQSYIDAVISQNSEATGTISVSGGIFKTEVSDKYIAEGYISKKVDNGYIIVKENTITVPDSIEEGTVSVSAKKAFIGDVITVTVTANTGYKIEKMELIGLETGSKETINNNQFIMPNEPVEVNVVFTKYTQEVQLPTIDKTEEVKDITIGVQDSTQANKILLETLLSNKEFAELVKTNDIKVEVEIKEIEASKDHETKINEELAKKAENIKISKYFDITIYAKNEETNAKLGILSELNDKIKFTVALPTEMQDVEEGYIRNYYIVMVHNGKVEILDTKLLENGKYLEFESSEFSTYAIAYNDVKQDDDSGNLEDDKINDDNENLEDDKINDDNENLEGDNINDDSEDLEDDKINDDNVEIEDVLTENEQIGPKTGDNVTIYVLLFIISIIGIIVSKVYKNKK